MRFGWRFACGNMKKGEKVIVSVFEVFILIMATVAFSYITGEIWGENNLVSAQTIPNDEGGNSTQNGAFSDEQVSTQRGIYDDYVPGISAEESVTQTETLIEGDYLRESEVNDPEKIRGAMQEATRDYQREQETGTPGTGSNFFLNFISSMLPSAAEVAVKPANVDILGQSGGIKICPVSIEGKICQTYP